jgi:ABC-2 type transport system ATP-binding protein
VSRGSPSPSSLTLALVLQARALTKCYAQRTVLDDFSFTVADGELVALLGANGAGKSTTMRCFLDFTRPTSGQALVDGIDVAREPLRAKARLAYVPDTVMVYDALTGRQNLAFFAGLGGVHVTAGEARRRLAEAGLPPGAADRPARDYSKGMRQKLGIAIAVARGARNLLLDEPTSGLDPTATHELLDALAGLRDGGAAILMATHLGTQGAADRTIVLADGRLAAEYARGERVAGEAFALGHPCARHARQAGSRV